MRSLHLLLLLGVFSCTKDTRLDISDLKFPDPHRIYIKNNEIDTTFIFYPQPDGRELKFCNVYDKNGRIIFEDVEIYVSVRYYYDRVGLLIKKETSGKGRTPLVAFISYEFDRDSTILTQKSTAGENKFLFDDKGRVRQYLEFRVTKDGKVLRQWINYVYSGDLLRKSLIYSNDKLRPDIEYDYYYSPKGILDSGTLRTYYGHYQKWVYDSLGLINAEWYSSKSDTRFVHKKRMRLATPKDPSKG